MRCRTPRRGAWIEICAYRSAFRHECRVAPRAGVRGLKCTRSRPGTTALLVAPRAGVRGLKFASESSACLRDQVAPRAGVRGLKSSATNATEQGASSRTPRRGAWIEIKPRFWLFSSHSVAPRAGVRGLKCSCRNISRKGSMVAPRAGVRGLKYFVPHFIIKFKIGRTPRRGAWIEMSLPMRRA